MPGLDQAHKLAQRQRQRQQILSLLDSLPKFTDRSLQQMARLRRRFLDLAATGRHTEAAALFTRSTDRLRRLGEKATIVQRSLHAAAATTDDVLAHPEKLADNLDREEIDQALAQSLLSVERARLDLQAQILDLDAIADEVDRLLDEQAVPS